MELKQFIDLLKFILAVPGGAAVLFLVVKLIISYWFKKNTEIEQLKAELKNKELDSIKEKMRALEYTIESNIKKTELMQTSQNNTLNSQRAMTQHLNETTEAFGSYVKKSSSILEEFSRITDQRMQSLESFNNDLKAKLSKPDYKSDTQYLGKDTMIIKGKKNE